MKNKIVKLYPQEGTAEPPKITTKHTGDLILPGEIRVAMTREMPNKWNRFWLNLILGIKYEEEN